MNAQLQTQPTSELRLRINPQRGCDLVIRRDDHNKLTCAAYARRRKFDNFMAFAVADIAQCRIAQGELLWIGSACFTLTALELTKLRDLVSPSVLLERP